MVRWRPELFFVVFVPAVVMLATSVVSFVSDAGRWMRGAIAYFAVIAGVLSVILARGGPDYGVTVMFVMVMGAVPAVAGVLAGWSAQVVRQSEGNRSRLLSVLLTVPALIVLAIVIRNGRDELRLNETALEQRLLAEVPLGSSMTDVTALIRSRGWELRNQNSGRGYFYQGVRPARTEGAQHIEGYAGSYSNLLTTDVVIYWGFDSSGKLTSIWVWKTTDGP